MWEWLTNIGNVAEKVLSPALDLGRLAAATFGGIGQYRTAQEASRSARQSREVQREQFDFARRQAEQAQVAYRDQLALYQEQLQAWQTDQAERLAAWQKQQQRFVDPLLADQGALRTASAAIQGGALPAPLEARLDVLRKSRTSQIEDFLARAGLRDSSTREEMLRRLDQELLAQRQDLARQYYGDVLDRYRLATAGFTSLATQPVAAPPAPSPQFPAAAAQVVGGADFASSIEDANKALTHLFQG